MGSRREADEPKPKKRDMDEPVKIPLDPQKALEALLAVDPDSEPTDEKPADETD